jgi:hypothetical protein
MTAFLQLSKKSRMQTVGTPLLLCVVLTVCFFGACDDPNETAVPDRNVFSHSAEQVRVTSPNGLFDAVLVRDPYGAAAGGGVNWNVYIVTKGSPVRMKTAHEFFSADPLTNGGLVWKDDHLLEIHYDIAHVLEFRNLWGSHEMQDLGSTGERDFEVEIRLVPSSELSILTPGGGFRHGN